MSNGMSYNDVQQLKNLIRKRLQEASGAQNGGGTGYGAMNTVRQYTPVANGRMAQANNMAARSMVNNGGMQGGQPYGQSPQYQPMQSQPMQSQPMRPQPMRQQPMRPQPMQSQPMRPQGMQSQSMRPQGMQPKAQPKAADNATPSLQKQIAKTVAKQQGGVHFDKYDCGHPYPKMSVRQHLKEEMGKSRNERVDNLRYAYVMSEILSEPVSKRRRRERHMM